MKCTRVSLMRDRMMKADAAGLQLCTHAIGDQGISTILDFYQEITKAHGEAIVAFASNTRSTWRQRISIALPIACDRLDAALPRHRRWTLGRGTYRA